MAGELDVSTVINDLLPTLHADSTASLNYWSANDLYEWADEGLKRLSRVAGVFVERDTTINTVNGTAAYALPSRHNATLHVSFGSAPLRPASVAELEARDPGFLTATGTPDHWYEDGQGSNVGLSPVPNSAANLPIVMSAWPVAVNSGQTLVQAPSSLGGYLAAYILAKAYGREGESEMPDVAAHCESKCQMYESILSHYYGEGL